MYCLRGIYRLDAQITLYRVIFFSSSSVNSNIQLVANAVCELICLMHLAFVAVWYHITTMLCCDLCNNKLHYFYYTCSLFLWMSRVCPFDNDTQRWPFKKPDGESGKSGTAKMVICDIVVIQERTKMIIRQW